MANLMTNDPLGLNHLSWFRSLIVNGEDLWPQIIKVYRDEGPDPRWDPHTLEKLGMIPNGYLEYYY